MSTRTSRKPRRSAFTAHGLSHVGRVRSENQDAFAIRKDLGLAIVADGIGGRRAGALAAQAVVDSLPALLQAQSIRTSNARDVLQRAIVELSVQLREQSREHAELAGMGATLAMVLVRDRVGYVANMGDSRVYLIRRNRLRQLTEDHSIPALLRRAKLIDAVQAENHPARHMLSRYVGMEGEPLPALAGVRLSPGDRLLLCTDGLTKELGDGRLLEFTRSGSPDNCCRRLLDAANEAGGRDNITVVVLEVGK